MATAVPRAAIGAYPGEAGTVYGKRGNITVPGADAADPILTTIETAAAATETDRTVSKTHPSGQYLPDAADYTAVGSERT